MRENSCGAQAGCTLVHYCTKYDSCEFPHHREDERLFSVSSSLFLTAQSQQTLDTFVIFHKCILIWGGVFPLRLGVFMAVTQMFTDWRDQFSLSPCRKHLTLNWTRLMILNMMEAVGDTMQRRGVRLRPVRVKADFYLGGQNTQLDSGPRRTGLHGPV